MSAKGVVHVEQGEKEGEFLSLGEWIRCVWCFAGALLLILQTLSHTLSHAQADHDV
jgi:hypothetical protein